MVSAYLQSRHDLLKELVSRLGKRYVYVSVLGKHVTGKRIALSTKSVNVADTAEAQCGFVVRVNDGTHYSEYSFSDITEENLGEIEENVIRELSLSENLSSRFVDADVMKDEPLVKDFDRPLGGAPMEVPEILEILKTYKDRIHAVSDKIITANFSLNDYETSSVFISKNRDLSQHYCWCSLYCFAVAREGATVRDAITCIGENGVALALSALEPKLKETAERAVEMLSAGLIEPGVYDIITSPSITGLIAHEAFGHGVEMDMFVKHRARSRHYVGKPVASSLVNMHDGAACHVPSSPSVLTESEANADASSKTMPCIGYFFDDDGVLSHDTQIIKDGILISGISDAVSASELHTEPTGNGRRENPAHKAYTRMTNTYFAPGKDKLEDMIASVKHGYMLFDTDNGMEDPKNWNIQCVACYGREIRDGKFTGKIVSPVVMSGYVPDLLMSISMVSDEWQITGCGHCGKGYKEWVPVSDGGPYLKARCKLG